MENTPVRVRIMFVWLIRPILFVVYEHLPRLMYRLDLRTLPALPNLPITETLSPCKLKNRL